MIELSNPGLGWLTAAYCLACTRALSLQVWWRTAPWVEPAEGPLPSTLTAPQSVANRYRSHVQPGDLIVLTEEPTPARLAVVFARQAQAIDEHQALFTYALAHRNGAAEPHKGHQEFENRRWTWVPRPDQLLDLAGQLGHPIPLVGHVGDEEALAAAVAELDAEYRRQATAPAPAAAPPATTPPAAGVAE